jgi:hypothetical protein
MRTGRDIAEIVDALSQRYLAREFSEHVMRASLKYKLPNDETESLIRRLNEQRVNSDAAT